MNGTEQHGGGRGRVGWCRARRRDFGSFRGGPCKNARNQSGLDVGFDPGWVASPPPVVSSPPVNGSDR